MRQQMTLRRCLIITILLLPIICLRSDAITRLNQNTQSFNVKGTTIDEAGSSLPKAKIIFKGKDFKKQIDSDSDGRFAIHLPAGVYRVTVKFQGCRDSKVKEFNVEAGKAATLNVVVKCPPTPIYD
jgi:hypothetical protein